MAISSTHYRLLRELKPLLPHGGALLEIGEANWYGDAVPDFPCRDTTNLFTIARDCYRHLFAPQSVTSIDFGGTESSLRLDLNAPVDLGKQFGLVINHGTAEHIFNIAQVFKTMHDHCLTDGLMIHESPFTDWIDHGFYCLQPTLFYDLAAANAYEIVLVAVEHIESQTVIRLESRDHVTNLAKAGELPRNAMLFVVFRKLADEPFAIPMQGYYARTLSKEGQHAWSTLR